MLTLQVLFALAAIPRMLTIAGVLSIRLFRTVTSWTQYSTVEIRHVHVGRREHNAEADSALTQLF